jgi:GNAT superfamily N-acetyltransferase
MDSLMAADFAQRLQKRLGIRSTAMVFEYPTVSLLAGHVLDKLALPVPASIGAAGVAMAAATPVAAATSATVTAPVAATTPAAVVTTGGRSPWPAEPKDALAAYFTSETPPGTPAADLPGPDVGRTEGYRPQVEPEVVEFQRVAWPQRAPDLIGPRWRWMFVESARRLNAPPQVWLHRHAGRIVGHNGAIPVRLKMGTEERLTAWLVDTMVLPEYRSQALGARLMMEAHDDLPLALSLGQTEQMRAIQLRLGWHKVAPLQTAQLLIRPERVLRGKMPAAAALAAGLALRAGGALREATRQRQDVTVRAISRFDQFHDDLWTLCSREITCAVRRDASYLNWKYVDQPGQDFLRLEISSPSGARGIVVLMFRQPDQVYRYRRAFIVDLVAPLANTGFMTDLLAATVAAAAERGADALLCLHIGSRLTAGLQEAGFRMREPSRYLLVRPGPLADGPRARLLDPDGWFVTQGDSDIDRP